MRYIFSICLLLFWTSVVSAQTTLQRMDAAIQHLLEMPVVDADVDLKYCDSLAVICVKEKYYCQLALIHAFQATIYSQQTKYNRAIEHMLKARHLQDSVKCSEEAQATLLWASSHVFMEMNDTLKADSFALSAMKMFKHDWKNKLLLIRLHRDYGIRAEDLPTALHHLDTAYQLAKKYDYPLFEVQVLINTGSSYAMRDSIDMANQYLHKALAQIESIENKDPRMNNYMMVLYNNLAGLSDNMKQTMMYLDSAIRYSVRLKDIKMEQTLRENKAFLYGEMGNYKDGYEAMWYALILKDTVLNVEKYRAITDMQEKYEAEKRTNEIQALKLENLDAELKQLRLKRSRNSMLAGGTLMLGLAIAFGYGFIAIRKSRKLIAIEKDRSEHLLLNILPADIAEELKSEGAAAARNHEMAAILFTDFKEFTQISSKMSAADLVQEINSCFKAFDRICKKYDIEKIKTIGDAYMAVGGLYHSGPEAVRKTVLAGLEIQSFINNRKHERNAQGLHAFEMRSGIHTGPVVSGIVGETKFQYDIWGDTVNTANRMESTGEAGRLNISITTYEVIKDDPEFEFHSRGMISAKGKGLIPMWFVTYANELPAVT